MVFILFHHAGTQLRIKYIADGQIDKGAYKMSNMYDFAVYGTLYASMKDITIPYKLTRKRIRGKK